MLGVWLTWQPMPNLVGWAGAALRIQAPARFRLIYTLDEWREIERTAATWTELGI